MMAPVNNTVEHYKKARLPPVASAGLIGWLRQNLFSSVSNTILTLVSVYLLSLAIPAILDWAFLSSQVSGNTRFDCKVEGGMLGLVGSAIWAISLWLLSGGGKMACYTCVYPLIPGAHPLVNPRRTRSAIPSMVLRCLSCYCHDLISGGPWPPRDSNRQIRWFYAEFDCGAVRNCSLPSGGNSISAGQAVEITADQMVINRLYRGYPGCASNNTIVCL